MKLSKKLKLIFDHYKEFKPNFCNDELIKRFLKAKRKQYKLKRKLKTNEILDILGQRGWLLSEYL